VGAVLPCGFCGRSGIPQCAIMITVKGDVVLTWETKCIYKHSFRYGSAIVGLKNTPSRNIPIKCELCHPMLPPQPRRTLWKVQAIPVDAIWHYNMVKHILTEHEEYVVPGHRETRVTLPSGVLAAMALLELEQKAVCILKECWPAL
ncbi:hypothetical protein EDB19DRAFT_1575377, partial [Suillus lakei]